MLDDAEGNLARSGLLNPSIRSVSWLGGSETDRVDPFRGAPVLDELPDDCG
jgi:hypothetical protein